MQRFKEFCQFLFMFVVNVGIAYGLVELYFYLRPYVEKLISAQ